MNTRTIFRDKKGNPRVILDPNLPCSNYEMYLSFLAKYSLYWLRDYKISKIIEKLFYLF